MNKNNQIIGVMEIMMLHDVPLKDGYIIISGLVKKKPSKELIVGFKDFVKDLAKLERNYKSRTKKGFDWNYVLKSIKEYLKKR